MALLGARARSLRRGLGLGLLALTCGLLSCSAAREFDSRPPAPTPVSSQAPRTLRLAWVSSYTDSDPWTLQIQNGILETLARNGYSRVEDTLEWEPVYMNIAQYVLPSHIAPAADAAIAQVQAFQPDLVIVSDDEAIRTVIPHYPDAQTPFVYCGLNNDAQEYDLNRPNVTGVLEVLRPEQNLEIARAFVNDTGHYLILSDASASGRLMAQNVYQALKTYQPDAPEPDLLVTAQWQTWQAEVLGAGDYDFILLTSAYYVWDSGGQYMDQETLLAWMLENSPVPVFAMSSRAVRYGAVAGLAPSGYAQGARAAELTLRIIHGDSPATIPVDTSARSVLLMNLAAARKWNLPIPLAFPLLAEVYEVLPLPLTPQGGAHD